MFKAGAKEVYLPTTESLLNEPAVNDLRRQILTSPEQSDFIHRKLRFIANRTMMTSAQMQGTNKVGSAAGNSASSPRTSMSGEHAGSLWSAAVFSHFRGC